MKYKISGDGWSAEYRAVKREAGAAWEITGEAGSARELRVERLEDGVFRLTLDGEIHRLVLLPGNEPGQPLRFLFDHEYIELRAEDELDLLDKALGARHTEAGPLELRSVMPGIIRKVLVKPGDAVALDQPVAILEAMKMENEVRAPRAGIVAKVLVREGTTLATGEPLLVIAPPVQEMK